MRENDEKVMGSFAESLFQSGSSEIKNWIGAAGALEHLNMELLNYAPAYRSAAGTGCGLGIRAMALSIDIVFSNRMCR
jgi:3-O-methylgallate 3,4-dioxygenase